MGSHCWGYELTIPESPTGSLAMSEETRGLLGVALAFVAALVLTPVVRALARRWGMVTRPRADRWAKKPTALLGGVGVFGGFAVAALTLLPGVSQWAAVLGGSAFLFLVGLVDDLRPLKPYQKLVGQIAGSAVVVAGGLALPWTPWPVTNTAITLVWLIGITNAVNLLDNMDGLAGGIGVIAAATLAASFYAAGDPATALFVAGFAAALAGFLVYNFNPASIFLGDCGSLFIGFFLASAALLNVSGGRVTGFVPVLAVPVLVLLVPIFDTTLVTVLRKLAGRAVSQGGRDHSSHRLVALGLSERRAVLLLYTLAALAGGLALLVRYVSPDVSLAMGAGFVLALTLLGIHLAAVRVYPEDAVDPNDRSGTAFPLDLSYKRRVFEVVLDVVLIVLAYVTAHLLVFGPLEQAGVLSVVVETLPAVIVLKLAAFLAVGVYRGIWRYVGVDDYFVFAKGVGAGSLLCVVAFLVAFRFQGLSRAVFTLDALLLFVLLAGSRTAFRLLRSLIRAPLPAGGRRALIYGAGDAGELLAREMLNNPRLGCAPVGFADDDPRKHGRVINGLPVLGGNGKLADICREHQVDEVYLSSARFSEERIEEIRGQCKEVGVGLKQMRISFETIEEENGDG